MSGTVLPPDDCRALIYVCVSDRHGRGTKAGGGDFLLPNLQHREGVKHFDVLGIAVDEEPPQTGNGGVKKFFARRSGLRQVRVV